MKPSPPFTLVPVEPIGTRTGPAFVDGYDPKTGRAIRKLTMVEAAVYPESRWGVKLRLVREGKGVSEPHITMGDAARALGMTPADISGLEHGRVTLASDEEWHRLLNHLRPSRIS